VQAQDPIVALLASDSAFANAVNAKQLDAAAAIAVQLVKVCLLACSWRMAPAVTRARHVHDARGGARRRMSRRWRS